MGAKKAPFYRLVAANSTTPRDGKTVAELGYYNPIKNPPIVHINEEQVLKWLLQGATPTDTARSLLRKQGILQRWDAQRKGQKKSDAPAEESSSQ